MKLRITLTLLLVMFLLTALFNCKPKEPELFTLTVNTSGWGEVNVSPEQEEYEKGTEVELVVETPARFWTFTGWEGDLSGTEVTKTIIMDSDKTVTAVFEGEGIFVSADNGSDSNDGTQFSPMATINAAITEASGLYTEAGVFVAEGTYEGDYETQTHIVMIEGISIYGGFSSDFNDRDRETYETIIQGNHTGTGSAQNFNRIVFCDDTITNNTHIDGFTINGGNGDFVSAVYIDLGSPTINNNYIHGGYGDSQSKAVVMYDSDTVLTHNEIYAGVCQGLLQAVFIKENSNPTISFNNIDGGSGYWNTQAIVISESTGDIYQNYIHGGSCDGDSIGIFNYTASPNVYNNVIIGGNCINSTKGMYNYNGSSPLIYNNIIRAGNGYWSIGLQNYSTGSNPKIYNNVITGGTGNRARAVEMKFGSAPEIINNIIFTEGGTDRYGIYEYTLDGDPAVVENNDIFNCPTALYYDEGDDSEYDEGNNGININDIATINALTDITAGANVSVDPQFENMSGNDYHLTTGSPTSVTEGGQDLSSEGISEDMDENPRSVPWSMGAYEYDE